MRITRLDAYQIAVPLRRKISHASFSRSESTSIIVKCELEDGTTGWGESVPRPYVTGESAETVLAQYEATDFRSLVEHNLETIENVVQICSDLKLAGLTEAPVEYQERGCFGNAARCAIELSLLDATARQWNMSLSELIPLLPGAAELSESQKSVQYSAVLTSMKPVKQTVLALLYRLTGFQNCKVKVGLPDIDDFALLRKIRRLTGRKMGLRLDANEAWSRHFLEEHTSEINALGIQSIEQPVSHKDLETLHQIRGQLATQIMLDESLCSDRDAELAIAEGYCDAFNLRISKLGGLIPTVKLAQMARQAGIRFQLGCQVGETGILSAAGRHFATSIQGIDFLEGSFDRYLLKQNIILEDLSFQWGGQAPALNGPGLGITVDKQLILGLKEREMTLI
ncbi:mandelate racemase/muconate lactonizing enzyme family protein [Gimesia algae]|uniref:L-Ala-D/L-Glu epimerase n=1 Tax=Gimesia algae TaxID=2527971 RepID=A0A517V792_9PLAN|nr:enolase C-terminal domain-like protein [Gimesia algae]QDT88854.1 L-Ala-D/L-Glu epimerase [Gimesia algae]